MKHFSAKRMALVLALLTVVTALVSCGGEPVEETYEYMDFSTEDPSLYITVENYMDLTIEVSSLPAEVTDADVQSALDDFIASVSSLEEYTATPERVTMKNDVLTVDYIGTVDGEQVEGFSQSGASVVLMDNNGYLDWFDNDLYGIAVGTTVTTTGTMDNDESTYGEYAGKQVTLQITVTAIAGHWTIPELTDELVAEKTVCSTVEEYKAYIRNAMTEEREEEARIGYCQKAWQMVLDLAQVKEYPDQQIQYYKAAYKDYYSAYAAQNGYSYEDFLTLIGMSEEDIAENARLATLEDLVFFYIVKEQNLSIDDEDYEKYIKQYEADQGITREEMEEEYGVDYIKECMLYDKTLYMIVDHATIVVTSAE